MNIRQIAEVLGKLDATNQSAEGAIADYILDQLKRNPQRPNKKVLIATMLQAYAFMLQEAGVKVEAE